MAYFTVVPPFASKDLLERLEAEVMTIGTEVGAYMGLDPPESFCGDLYEVTRMRIDRYEPDRSLRAWVWGYVRLTVLKVRKEQGQCRTAEITTDPIDPHFHDELTSLFRIDDPDVLEDTLTEEVELLLERQRQSWPLKRKLCWAEALRAGRLRDRGEATSLLRKTALYDMFISSKTPELLIPWMVIIRRADREHLASQYEVTRHAIDKRISRFKSRVQAKAASLTRELEGATGLRLS